MSKTSMGRGFSFSRTQGETSTQIASYNATSERRKESRSRSPSLSEEFNSEFRSKKSRSPKTLWFPTEDMNVRHQELLKMTIPAMDLTDRFNKRQFAPEYSQSAYITMLEEESAVGCYLKSPSL